MATCVRPDVTSGIVDQRQFRLFSPRFLSQHARLLAVAAVALLPLVACAQLANTAWPKFLGNAQNTSQGQGQGATNSVKWTFTAQAPIYTAPSIGADGTVYVGSDDFNVYALNPATGAVKWTFATQSYVESSPAIGSDGTVYVGSDDNNLYALNGSTGVVMWSFGTTSFIDASPCIGPDGTVYVGSTDGNLYALNGATGALLWKFGTQGAVESSPALGADGTVYFGSDDGNVYALVGKTGALKWSYALQVPVFNSPSVGPDGTVFVGADAIYALVGNATTVPTVKWTYNYGYDVTCPISITSTGFLVVATADGQVRYLSTKGDLQWFYQGAGGIYEGAPSIGSDGTIYLASDAGILSAVSPTGTEIWNYTAPAEVFGSSAVISGNGTLYLGGLSGNLVAFQSLTPQALTVAPSTVAGGVSATGTVTLNLPAAGTGLVVTLSSSSPDALVPASVTIPSGAITATFQITTSSVTKSETVTLTAGVGTTAVTGTVTIVPPALTGISFSPAAVSGGTYGVGTLTLNGPAPTGGVTVSLKSSATAYVTVPAVVFIAAGKSSVTFQASTTAVTAAHSSVVTATYGTVSETATLTVNPATLSAFSVSPTVLAGGNTATGTVSITAPAAIAITIKLSSDTKAVTVPLSVVIAKGKSTGTFTIHTVAVSAATTATIQAGIGTSVLTSKLTVTAPSLASITFAAKSVVGGISDTGTVKLTGPAGSGGMTVGLVSSTTSATVPATVKVPQGALSTTFVAKTIAVATNVAATVTASLNDTTVQGSFTITAPTVKALVLAPPTVKGGKSVTGTVTISSAAPAAGLTLTLASDSGSTTLPKTLVIPAGKLIGTFKIATTAVTAKTVANISAGVNASSKSAKLTIS